jgi:hypothetical protein
MSGSAIASGSGRRAQDAGGLPQDLGLVGGRKG